MKKIFILSLLLLVIKTGSSQDVKPFRLGLNAAPGLAWLKPDVKNYETKGVKMGFSYGLSLEFAFGDNYSFATGLFVGTNGGGLEFPDSTYIDTVGYRGNTIRKHNLQYLQFPFTLKLKTNEIGYMTYFGKFGIETGFLLKARGSEEFEDLDLSIPKIVEEDLEDFQKDILFLRAALYIAAGVEYSLGGNTSLVGELFLSNGFLNVYRKSVESIEIDGETRQVRAKSSIIGINAGILF